MQAPRSAVRMSTAGPSGRGPTPQFKLGAQISVNTQNLVKTSAVPSEVAELTGDDKASWDATKKAVMAMGIDNEEQAEKTLKRAFGWAGKAYWRQERPEPEVPTPEAVQAVQAYLVSLGLTGAEVAKVVDDFPEVLGCSVEDRLAANVAQLEKQWKMQGPAIKGVVLRRPDVLGFNLDCLGDCAGECNRCWVRF